MYRDRFLQLPLQFVDPLAALDFVLERDHGAGIGSWAGGSPEAQIVVQVVSERYPALGEVFVLEFELLAGTVDRPATNQVEFLLGF